MVAIHDFIRETHMAQTKPQLMWFGVFMLVAVGFLVTIYLFSPSFFVTYLVPIAIFMTLAFVGIMAIILASGAKKGRSK